MEIEITDVTSQLEREANARRLSPVRNIIAGGIGGMLAVATGHPLDTIKVRLQVASSVGQAQAYNGAIDCLKNIVKEGGFRSLYRGMLSPLLMATPMTALSFYSFSLGKRMLVSDPGQEPEMLHYMLAGAFAGFTSSFVVTPVERIKCLLQVKKTDSKGAPRGPFQVLLEIYRSQGVRGIFRGLPITLGRDVLGSAFWYLGYEGVLKLTRPRDSTRDDVAMTAIVLSGACAGIVFWGVMYPVDIVKTRYQTAQVGLYRGSRDVLREVLRIEGAKALYRGYVPTIARAPLVNIAVFVGYELTIKALNRFSP